MVDRLTIDATLREETGKGAARAARREGLVPGVKAGRFMTQLLHVSIGGEKIRVICRDVQRDVVKDLPTHVDFLRLSRTSRIKLFIPLRFEGAEEAPGTKAGGTLGIVRNEVEMNVLADNIPEELVADVSGLQIGDSLHISGIELPEGASLVINDRDFTLANMAAPGGLGSADDEEAEGEDGAETEGAAEASGDSE